MLSKEEPKTVIIKKGEKMERYRKKTVARKKRVVARKKRLRLAGLHVGETLGCANFMADKSYFRHFKKFYSSHQKLKHS